MSVKNPNIHTEEFRAAINRTLFKHESDHLWIKAEAKYVMSSKKKVTIVHKIARALNQPISANINGFSHVIKPHETVKENMCRRKELRVIKYLAKLMRRFND